MLDWKFVPSSAVVVYPKTNGLLGTSGMVCVYDSVKVPPFAPSFVVSGFASPAA